MSQPVPSPQPGYAQPAYAQPGYAVPTQQQYSPQQPPYAPQQPPHSPQQQPYAQPQQYAPQQPYPVAGPGQQAPEVECRLCRSVPAARAKFRGHQGMIIIMRFLSLDGPFCRDCGLATYRRMTSRTLVQGWWGYASFIITPLVVLYNLIPRQKVASLPAPRPAAHGQSQHPLDPSPALLMRPMTIIGLAIPWLLLMLLVALIVVNNT
ncbi:hypothetical protein AB0J86_20875 [Micromonospora sp. NPDC049559]|uniref:hypothetical protein n=1 Tax=Micromonospora sp. NPDC049559 TaxID=3155923 RepID=UPI003421B683